MNEFRDIKTVSYSKLEKSKETDYLKFIRHLLSQLGDCES